MPTDPKSIQPARFVLARRVGLPWRRHDISNRVDVFFLTSASEERFQFNPEFQALIKNDIRKWVSTKRPHLVVLVDTFARRVRLIEPDTESVESIRRVLASERDFEKRFQEGVSKVFDALIG